MGTVRACLSPFNSPAALSHGGLLVGLLLVLFSHMLVPREAAAAWPPAWGWTSQCGTRLLARTNPELF